MYIYSYMCEYLMPLIILQTSGVSSVTLVHREESYIYTYIYIYICICTCSFLDTDREACSINMYVNKTYLSSSYRPNNNNNIIVIIVIIIIVIITLSLSLCYSTSHHLIDQWRVIGDTSP
jgi:uncharacterized membrane protein